MPVSLSEFFCVEVEPHELKRCLDYTSTECKLAAWYGDALLAMFVSQRIFEKDPHNIGTMTRRKAHYVSNATMEEFLLDHTDAVSRLPDAASMSVHSFGTVFEALLELCHKKSGPIVAKSCVDKYCDWVDANTFGSHTIISVSYCDFNTGFVGFTNFPDINTYTMASKEKMNTMIVEVMEGLESWINEAKLVRIEEARVKASKGAKSVVSTKQSKAGSSPSPTTSEHINSEMTTAAWRSNSKKWYEDKYYRCCGVRDGVLTCLRPLWIDATDSCHHPGTLDIPDKKAEFQSGESQYGRGKTPKWTCCNRTAVAPGCVSNQPNNFYRCKVTGVQHPSLPYKTKVGQWLEDYEHVVKEESSKAVGAGGVVHNKKKWSLWDDVP
eukprot:gene10212-11953_t